MASVRILVHKLYLQADPRAVRVNAGGCCSQVVIVDMLRRLDSNLGVGVFHTSVLGKQSLHVVGRSPVGPVSPATHLVGGWAGEAKCKHICVIVRGY